MKRKYTVTWESERKVKRPPLIWRMYMAARHPIRFYMGMEL